MCPRCQTLRVHLSRARNAGEVLLKLLLPVSMYRCEDCGWRWPQISRNPRRLLIYAISVATLVVIGISISALATELL